MRELYALSRTLAEQPLIAQLTPSTSLPETLVNVAEKIGPFTLSADPVRCREHLQHAARVISESGVLGQLEAGGDRPADAEAVADAADDGDGRRQRFEGPGS